MDQDGKYIVTMLYVYSNSDGRVIKYQLGHSYVVSNVNSTVAS